MAILKQLHSLLFPNAEVSFDGIPQISIGGWNGWPYVIGSSMLLRNSGGEKILIYCILDADYHIETAKQARLEQAIEKNIQLHIWEKKEIENYLVIPSVLERIINSTTRQQKTSEQEVVDKISLFCDTMKNDTTDAFANEYLQNDRHNGLQNANRLAREFVDKYWNNIDSKTSIVSGKALLSRLSEWSQNTFGVSFGVRSILNSIQCKEIPKDLRDIIVSIETGKMFH
jgi:DNA-binding ferritin-like protein (Dps family)